MDGPLFSLESLFAFTHDDARRCSALDPTSELFKRLAWLGDAYLQWYLSERAWARSFEKTQPSLGDLQDLRERYKTNDCLAEFLRRKTNILSLISPPSNGTRWSTHSLGSVFEALLALCLKQCGKEAANSAIQQLMTWYDQEGQTVLPQRTLESRIVIQEGNTNGELVVTVNGAQTHSLSISAPSSSAQALLCLIQEQVQLLHEQCQQREKEQKEAEMRRAVEALKRRYMYIPPSESEHRGDLVSVTWRSRSGLSHEHFFYRCCGQLKGKNCTQRNPHRYHPGSLHISSSRRSGGGRTPTGGFDDFMGHPREPSWTCCRQLATAEGCSPVSDCMSPAAAPQGELPRIGYA